MKNLHFYKEKIIFHYHKVKAWTIGEWKTMTWRKAIQYGLYASAGIAALVLLLMISVWLGIFGHMPNKSELKTISNPLASVVMGDRNQIIGKYFIENRTNATFEEISPHVIMALIATEDERFMLHRGIDWRAWGRVLVKSILLQKKSSGGGSTITQQLAKNLFPRKNYWFFSLPINKLREIIIARRMEHIFNKNEIITLYLNTVSFGGNAFGIKTAVKQLFNRPLENLKIEEAALLVGMLKATTFYHPAQNEERARERRNVVFQQMLKNGVIDSSVVDSLQALPVTIQYVQEGHHDGPGTYFREHLRLELLTLLEQIEKETGKKYNLYTDGLKIYTTLDFDLQQTAEQAVARQMTRLQREFNQHWRKGAPWAEDKFWTEQLPQSEVYKAYRQAGLNEATIKNIMSTPRTMSIFSWDSTLVKNWTPLDSLKYYFGMLQAGFLAADVKSGAIKAWVGGIHSKYFQYDHVKARRQVGSAFKPVVYGQALINGYSPCDYFDNQLITYPEYDNWSPGNADENYGGMYSLQGALAKSVNTVTVALGMELGVDSVRQLARRMGIESPLPKVPSLFLGTAECSLWEMVQMYQAIANKGLGRQLFYLIKIEDYAGNEIYQAPGAGSFQAMPEEHAVALTHMLENVVNRGTGASVRSAYAVPGDLAGKTGTTQSHADGWFLGFNPGLVAGAWVGGESPLVRFRNLTQGQGAYTALPIWAVFFQKAVRRGKYSGQYFNALSETYAYDWDCDDFIADWQPYPLDSLSAENEAEYLEPDSIAKLPPKERRQARRERRKNAGLRNFLDQLFNNRD